MRQNKLALMAIPVLAAVLIGGSIVPAAYAGAPPQKCISQITQIIDAFDKENYNKLQGLLKAFNASCLEHHVPPQCAAMLLNFIDALIDQNYGKAEGIINAALANGCLD